VSAGALDFLIANQ